MRPSKLVLVSLLLLLLVTACGKEAPPPPTEENIPPPPATSTFTPLPPTPVPPTPTLIVHSAIPGEPVFLLAQLISDCTVGNGVTVGDPVILSSGCDRWDFNKIERPFNDDFQNYAPQSDISRAQIGYDETWFFAQAITYFGEVVEPQPMNGTYGIELDLDLDGRGDVLVLASQPSEEWNVAGVRVYLDTDITVGANTPVLADEENPNGGYDEMVFDAGQGLDSDLAWARISPDDPNVVQLAFKRSLGGEKDTERFSWVMWAGLLDFNPGEFDYVDTFSENELYSIDNTCSWTFGIPLTGLPNQCGIKVEEKVEGSDKCVQPPKPIGGCSWIWFQETCSWENYC